MACPFFMPLRKLEADGTWFHPSRLPLKGAWDGHCCAPGHEGAQPLSEELKQCNLGYAANCSRLPRERSCDAVRFSIVRDAGSKLVLCFVCELDHHPAEHGILEYDLACGRWQLSHPDARLQKMAQCYLEAYLQHRSASATA